MQPVTIQALGRVAFDVAAANGQRIQRASFMGLLHRVRCKPYHLDHLVSSCAWVQTFEVSHKLAPVSESFSTCAFFVYGVQWFGPCFYDLQGCLAQPARHVNAGAQLPVLWVWLVPEGLGLKRSLHVRRDGQVLTDRQQRASRTPVVAACQHPLPWLVLLETGAPCFGLVALDNLGEHFVSEWQPVHWAPPTQVYVRHSLAAANSVYALPQLMHWYKVASLHAHGPLAGCHAVPTSWLQSLGT